jgi:hypothetical protein
MATTRPARPPEGLFVAPRPVTALGDLFANLWQLGYVTTDLDRGIAYLGARFGLEHAVKLPVGGTFLAGEREVEFEARFAMAARGGLIVELIEPVAGEVGFYRQLLPDDGSFAVRLHHLATFIETGDAAWSNLGGLLREAGLTVDYTLLIPGRVRAGYVDMREDLGHWIEVCQLEPADTGFFSSLVNESA